MYLLPTVVTDFQHNPSLPGHWTLGVAAPVSRHGYLILRSGGKFLRPL